MGIASEIRFLTILDDGVEYLHVYNWDLHTCDILNHEIWSSYAYL